MLSNTPQFPGFVRRPLAAVPAPLKSHVLARALNIVFSSSLKDGNLGFLEDKTVNVSVPDADIHFSLTVASRRFRITLPHISPDLEIRGNAYAFLQLASRTEDSDTLFFQRRIMTSGDTELGLLVKNFLEGIDPESLPFDRVIGYALKVGLRTANSLNLFDATDK